jgi:uncharacterized protein
MASKVFFSEAKADSYETSILNKIKLLWDAADFSKLIKKKGDLVAIKMHFGEIGNNTFIPPWYARVIVEKVKQAGGKPFLTDCNTVYVGSRHNAPDHLYNANLHGFTHATVDCPVIIADGWFYRGKKGTTRFKTEIRSRKMHGL